MVCCEPFKLIVRTKITKLTGIPARSFTTMACMLYYLTCWSKCCIVYEFEIFFIGNKTLEVQLPKVLVNPKNIFPGRIFHHLKLFAYANYYQACIWLYQTTQRRNAMQLQGNYWDPKSCFLRIGTLRKRSNMPPRSLDECPLSMPYHSENLAIKESSEESTEECWWKYMTMKMDNFSHTFDEHEKDLQSALCLTSTCYQNIKSIRQLHKKLLTLLTLPVQSISPMNPLLYKFGKKYKSTITQPSWRFSPFYCDYSSFPSC